MIFHKKACHWFSDYTTEIRSPSGLISLGKLQEFVAITDEEEVPEDVWRIRRMEFEEGLCAPPETVMYYKKVMRLEPNPKAVISRRYKLTNIFLFNIRWLLEKASNAFEEHLIFNEENKEITTAKFPKVYHIDIVMKNRYQDKNRAFRTEIKKFRLIVDKTGIKRVERLFHRK